MRFLFVAMAAANTVEVMPGYSLEWDITGQTLQVTISAATTGWVGFGLASSGGMYGADMLIASVDASGTGSIGDYWARGEMTPSLDEQQDWTLHSATEVGGVTTIVASRALSTGDAQDWEISASQQPSGQWIIAAMGTVDTLSQHASSNRIALKLNLFSPSSTADPMHAVRAIPGIESLNFTVQNYVGRSLCDPIGTTRPGTSTAGVTHVQTQCVDAVTDYSDFCFSFAANGFADEAHAVAFEWIHTAENADIIHHYVIYGHYSDNCDDGGAGSVQLGEHLGEWSPLGHLYMHMHMHMHIHMHMHM